MPYSRQVHRFSGWDKTLKSARALLFFVCVLPVACAPLEFSALAVEDIAATRAVVKFTTSQPATCEVELGERADVLDRHYVDPNMPDDALVEEHSVPIENLEPSTTYYFRARAVNASGQVFFSGVEQFTTSAGDATANETNVALLSAGANVVSVSSVFGGGTNDSGFGANRAFDGDFATEWSTNGDGTAAFVEIDFGQTRALSVFGFRSRSMADGSSIITRVGITLDGTSMLGPFDIPDHTRLYRFELPAGTSARRARVFAVESTGGNTGAKEIQFSLANGF